MTLTMANLLTLFSSVVTTIVSLMVFYKGKQLDQTYLQNILTPDKVEKLKKLAYLHKEDTLQLLQKADVKQQEKSSVSQVFCCVVYVYFFLSLDIFCFLAVRIDKIVFLKSIVSTIILRHLLIFLDYRGGIV